MPDVLEPIAPAFPLPERHWRNGRVVIGPSDLAVVLGQSPYDTPLGLFRKIRGLDPMQGESWDMTRGKALEPGLAAWYERHTGYEVRTVAEQAEHFLYPWLRYSIDRAVEPNGMAAPRGLECKVYEGKPALWGEPGTDQIPPWFLPQVHAYAYLDCKPEWDVCADVLRGGPAIWTIAVDREFVLEYCLPAGQEFVRRCEANEPPAATKPLDLREYQTARVTLEADEGLRMDAQTAARLKWERDGLDRDYEACRFRIERALNEAAADALVDEGRILATNRQDRNGKRRFRLVVEHGEC